METAGRDVPVVLRWVLLLVVAAVPWVVRTAFYHDYPGADDAFIHLAIIDSLRESGTWGINPGEPVNLSTSPLFTLVFLGFSFLFRDVMTVGSVLSVLLVCGSVLLTFKIASRYFESFWPALGIAAFAAFNVQLWRWTGTFMEATFAYFAVLLNVWLHLVWRERTFGLGLAQGLVLGLSVMLRPELALLGVALFLQVLMVERERTWARAGAVFAGFAVVLGAYAIWARGEFGSVLPSTFYAKTSSGLEFVNVSVAKQFVQVVGSAFPGLFLVGLVWFFLSGKKRCPEMLLYALFPLLGLLFFYLKAPMLQSAGRYFLPFLATVPLTGVPIVQRVASSRMAAVVPLAVGLQAIAALYLNATRIAPVLQRMWPEYVATMSEASEEIVEHVPEGESVLVYYDIGVVSWQVDGRRRILDGGALATPELRGMDLDQMLDKTGTHYLLESLGHPDYPLELEGRGATLLWERSFLSHGVESKDRTFVTRFYRLGP